MQANQFIVRTCGDHSEFGTVTSTEEEYCYPWRGIYPEKYRTCEKPLGKERQQELLIQGLLPKAYRISSVGKDRAGKPLRVISPRMQKVFGSYGGKVSIQRSPLRWVKAGFVDKAIKIVTVLV